MYDRYDSAEKLEPADRIEQRLSTEPIDPTDRADPIDPIRLPASVAELLRARLSQAV